MSSPFYFPSHICSSKQVDQKFVDATHGGLDLTRVMQELNKTTIFEDKYLNEIF